MAVQPFVAIESSEAMRRKNCRSLEPKQMAQMTD